MACVRKLMFVGIGASIALTVSACGAGETTSGRQPPASEPQVTASFVEVPATNINALTPVKYSDDKRGITADVVSVPAARNLSQAALVVRDRILREAYWDKSTKVDIAAKPVAASPDVVGIAVTGKIDGPTPKDITSTLWFDARRSQTFSSPVLIEPSHWKEFAEAVHKSAQDADVDAAKVDEALIAPAAPYGNGPAMAFNSDGDLVVTFSAGAVADKSVSIVVGKDTVKDKLSDVGELAQGASTSPSEFTGKPSRRIERFSPGSERAKKTASPNIPTDGNPPTGDTVPQPTPGGAVRPSTAVGVDCIANDCVALTYDDGPGEGTPKLLQDFAKHRAAATFFQLGNNIKQMPQIAKEVASSGMEVGSHTQTHNDLARMGEDRLKKEITGNSDLLEKTIGQRPVVFRPPYGSHNERADKVIEGDGMAIMQWSVDTNDWKTKSTPDTVSSATSGALNNTEPIVLMHDIHASTVAAAPEILETMQKNNIIPVTVSELSLNTGGLQAGHAYCRGTGIEQQGFACKG